MSNQFKGQAHIVGAEIVKSDKFKVRQLVVKDDSNPQYPNYVEFQFSNKNCDKLNGINPGDEITVDYNLRGREWTSPTGEVKYFNTLDGWKVEVHSRYTPSSAPAPVQQFVNPNEPQDLPF
jgi:hypothetical protein